QAPLLEQGRTRRLDRPLDRGPDVFVVSEGRAARGGAAGLRTRPVGQGPCIRKNTPGRVPGLSDQESETGGETVSNPDEQPPQYELALERTIWIAGRRFHPRASLGPGEAVNLVREPENPHDGNAIAVITLDGDRAGYLPRDEASEWAVLVDEGII